MNMTSDRRRATRTLGLIASTLLLVALPCRALERPAAPQVGIEGTPGAGQACYWVAAADGNAEAGGKMTDLSPAATVNNLPAALDKANHAVITIAPVAGAKRYYVFKTAPLPKPEKVTVTVKTPGDKSYCYWLVVCNVWQQSALYGPYPAGKCGDPAGNVIEWTPVPNASWYHLYRTATPQPPVGRTYCAVGLQLGIRQDLHPGGVYGSTITETKMVDAGTLGYAVAGEPVTPYTELPVGESICLLAVSDGKPVYDEGQPLQKFIVPSLNQTQTRPLTVPANGSVDLRGGGHGGALFELNPRVNLSNLVRPSFISGYSPFLINEVIESGPASDYFGRGGTPGWKSTMHMLELHQESHAAAQHTMLGGYQRNYGSGDTMYYNAHTTVFGQNNDDGDEGCFSARMSMNRGLQELPGVLDATVPRGGTKLPMRSGDFGPAGTERLLVNLTQGTKAGRIRRVGNVDVHGKDTKWTKEMASRWISFDVDTVRGKRMWYPIVEVISPTELRIFARTGWSQACNLGYSRFIFDPAESDGPKPMNTNVLANRYLPPENLPAARDGGYLICPGALLGNPYRSGQTLNVEPLREEWRAGDQVLVTAGPQAYLYLASFMMGGEYLPQDNVHGIGIFQEGNVNRMANGPALSISHPGQKGFAEGVRVNLSSTGASDGLVITAANGYDAQGFPAGNAGVYRGAVVLPENLPAIVGEHDWRYPHIRWAFSEAGANDALQFAMKNGTVLASISRDGTTLNGTTTVSGTMELEGALRGNAHTRGKAVFDGDGKQTEFVIRFEKLFAAEPFVTLSSNQFAAHRLAEVAADHVTVAFREAPDAGTRNVVVYWLAQE